ncbi:MAG TPA: FRG domain-containing protein, partial [bacterium]|nr:FRG domain-containing protein [bacterium]
MRDYDSLLEVIGELPPPQRGFERVYRGQTRHFKTITPTAFRSGAGNRPQWYAATQVVAKSLVGEGRSPEYDSERVAAIVTTEAALQHYAANSQYLDVTRNPAVALWFALHASEWSEIEVDVSKPESGEEVTLVAPMLAFQRRESSGVFYVFDVPVWSGGPRSHGRLF